MGAHLGEWRDLVEFDSRYQVSSLGEVRSTDRVTVSKRGHRMAFKGRTIKQHPCIMGYQQVGIRHAGVRHTRKVHALVCAAFHGPRPPGLVVRHMDGDSQNNSAVNLTWGTPAENAADAMRHGTMPRGESSGMAKLTVAAVIAMRVAHRSGDRINDIASRHGVSDTTAGMAIRGRTWAHVPMPIEEA